MRASLCRQAIHELSRDVQAVELVELADAGRAGDVDLGEVIADHIEADEIQTAFAQRRADVKLLRAALGLSKKRLRIATPEEVLAATGFEVGGVPPVGHHVPLRTLVDASLARFDTVWAAAGSGHAVFPIAYRRLLDVTSGQVLDLAEQG